MQKKTKTEKDMSTLNEIFNVKLTENGDKSFNSTMNPLLDLLFMSEYYQNHLDEVRIGNSEKEQLFAMFMRDPRYGVGRRDYGRELMKQSGVPMEGVILAGRFDDLFYKWEEMSEEEFNTLAKFLYREIYNGNELLKKWMPRYSSKNLLLARKFAKAFGMNKQQYGHFVKCDTVENKLSRKDTDSIVFEHVPSLAMLKYFQRFMRKDDTRDRFNEYLESVKSGNKEIKVTTTNVYDIYRNRQNIDPDVFFEALPKTKGNWLPVIDTSGSMDYDDAMGKALAIGHYLAKTSTYAPDTAISFSSRPQLIKLGQDKTRVYYEYHCPVRDAGDSKYLKEIKSLFTGDCSNTDFGAVMDLLKDLTDVPEYLVVLSDMEFDCGSNQSKEELEALWKERGYNTKIVWWNLNGRNKTVPEIDKNGNIYMSGYSPQLLQYLESGFDGNAFLENLLTEYAKKITADQ